MSDERDFAIDPEDLQSAAERPASPVSESSSVPAPDQAPPRMVLIQYRNRGIHLALLPPLLILLAALVIMSYQRQPRLRPLATPPLAKAAESATSTTASADQGRIIMVDPSSTGAAVEPITVRAARPLAPTPVAPPMPATAAENALAHVEKPVEPRPFAPFDRMAGDEPETPPSATTQPSEIADEPPLIPPTPIASVPGDELSADSPERTFRVAAERLPGMGEPSSEPEPAKVTKEEILKGIQAEAQQKKDEQKILEREMAQSRAREHQEMIRKSHAERIEFHKELRRLLKEMGDGAGAEIGAVCDRYGRTIVPEVHKTVVTALNRWAARLNQEAKIKMMRSHGLPETVILDYIANDLHKSMGGRGGPRDRNEVLARAARRLILYPPPANPPTSQAGPERPAAVTRSVAGVATVPVPKAGRPPQ